MVQANATAVNDPNVAIWLRPMTVS